MSERSTSTIVSAMYDEFDNLRNGKSTPQAASALSRMANTMFAGKRLEMDYSRFVSNARANEDNNGPMAVPID